VFDIAILQSPAFHRSHKLRVSELRSTMVLGRGIDIVQFLHFSVSQFVLGSFEAKVINLLDQSRLKLITPSVAMVQQVEVVHL
jgi:hypothetical protein